MEDDRYESKGLNENFEKVARYEDAITIVREYETIVKTLKKTFCNVYRQGYIFKKV